MSKKQIKRFWVHLPNWEKHNGTKKKNHRYIFLDTRFFEDAKICQLRQIEVLVFVKCLTIAGDLLSNSFEIHAGMMPKRWRIDDKLMENCCKSLQEFQLLTYQNSPSLIHHITSHHITSQEFDEVDDGTVGESEKDHEVIFQIWNDHRGTLPEARTLSSKRKKSTKERWKENPDLDYWVSTVKRLANSDYCCGKNDRGWLADFDFLIRPDTHVKTSEGKYDNRVPKNPNSHMGLITGEPA